MLSDLTVSEYELLFDESSLRSIVIRLRRAPDRNRWSISKGANESLCKVPNEYGFFTFHWEPNPSSRGDEFFRDYRFDTAEEAHEFWASNRTKIIATQDDLVRFGRFANKFC